MALFHYLLWLSNVLLGHMQVRAHTDVCIHSVASVLSDSLWPCGLQSTRLLCPWDFLDKNTGWVAISSYLWTVAHQAPLFMRFSRQEYWSGLPFLLPGSFPIQGSNPHLLPLLLPDLAEGFRILSRHLASTYSFLSQFYHHVFSLH